MFSAVGMQTAKEIGDSEIGEQHEQESHDAVHVVSHIRRAFGQPEQALQLRPVKQSGIDEHRDECPGLFGVPTPITTPGQVSPYGTDEDTRCKAELGRI